MVGLTPVSDSWDVGGEEKTVYGQVEEATVTSLRPATLYHIRLFAENELGRSKEGRVLQVGAVYYTPATLYHIRLFAENELGRSKEGRVQQV